MSFVLPELVVESVLREGLASMLATPSIIDDVLGSLTETYANTKYGATELQTIKDVLAKRKLSIVHSKMEAEAKENAISIQLSHEGEDTSKSRLEDLDNELLDYDDDDSTVHARLKVANVLATAYDPISGILSIDDSVDLSTATNGFYFVDDNDVEYQIVNGVSNETGAKVLCLEPNLSLTTPVTGTITSFINFTETEVRGITDKVVIILGVHSKRALLAKYLYVLVKFILSSRKMDLDSRRFMNTTYTGSDFNRDSGYTGDQMFSRYLTITGLVEQSWSDKVVIPVEYMDFDITMFD